MLLSASKAIFMTKVAVEHVRKNELAMETRAIYSEFWDQHRDRKKITGDGPGPVARRNNRLLADNKKIAKQVDALQLLPKHTQTVAAWVFTTTWFGPPNEYMRVIPLPVRSFV
jgi:hypothetical protein